MTQLENNKSGNAKAFSRRSIVKAAALSAPVIVFGMASPSYAASTQSATVRITNATEIEEAFTGPGFFVASGTPGGGNGAVYELHGLQIDATVDGGTPAAVDELITVSLPAGLVFRDGSTVKEYKASGSFPSVKVPYDDITVAKNATAGMYTVTVAYLDATQKVTARVIEGNLVHAWGNNDIHQAHDSGGQIQPTPWSWGPSNGPAPFNSYTSVFYTTYTALTGAKETLNAYTDLFETVVTSGLRGLPNGMSAGRVRMARGVATSLVTNNKGQASDATFFWGPDGHLYATGSNNADMFSLGDGTPYDGSTSYTKPVKVGVKVLAANPGKTVTSVHLGADDNRVAYILSDKTVWNSGRNNHYSAMGLNVANSDRFLAGQTLKSDGSPLTDIVSVAIAFESTVYLDGSGNLWGSGYSDNAEGQLVGVEPNRYYIAAMPLALPEGKPVRKVWAAGLNVIVQATDGTCYIAGANSSGLGSTGSTARSRNAWTRINVAAGKTVADIAISEGGALYRMTDGTVYFAGGNSRSGNGVAASTTLYTSMVRVPLAGPASDIAVTHGNTYAALVPSRY